MRAGLLAGLMVMALGSGVVAQEPSPGALPLYDGRVEMPEYGFALTFPGGWTVEESTLEDALLVGRSVVLNADWSGDGGVCLVSVDDSSMRDEPVLLSGEPDTLVGALEQDMDSSDEGPVRIDLAAGPSWRIDVVVDAVSSSTYLLRGPDGLLLLFCFAADPPVDRWFSIADTIEFLPDPATGSVPASPLLGSGRIERPEEGFVVTVPDDWTVEEVTPETHAWLFDTLDRAQRVLRQTVLWADQPDSDGYRIIEDFTRPAEESPPWTTIDEPTGWFFDGLTDPGFVGPASTIEDLPAGPTGHITATDPYGWAYGAYYFTDGDEWFSLDCRSPNPPADDWLSIAESFEFLPEDE